MQRSGVAETVALGIRSVSMRHGYAARSGTAKTVALGIRNVSMRHGYTAVRRCQNRTPRHTHRINVSRICSSQALPKPHSSAYASHQFAPNMRRGQVLPKPHHPAYASHQFAPNAHRGAGPHAQPRARVMIQLCAVRARLYVCYYAHHMPPLLSNIMVSLSMAMAFLRPSLTLIRLSSCSIEMGPS